MSPFRWSLLSVVLVAAAVVTSWDSVSDVWSTKDGGEWIRVFGWALVAVVAGIPVVGGLLRAAGCGSSDSRTARWMGAAERLVFYTLFLLTAPKSIAAFVAFKTAIRWPRFDEDAHADSGGAAPSRFAEAFLLAMIFNLAIAATAAWLAGARFTNMP
jgi:hypothetical protein